MLRPARGVPWYTDTVRSLKQTSTAGSSMPNLHAVRAHTGTLSGQVH